MKKLMTILSAAALATGAFADTATVTTGTETFEGFTAGVNITTNTPTPTTDGEYLWYSAGDADEGETGTVTAYADGDAKPANGAASNNQYLNVSTTTGTPLYRTVSSHSGTITTPDAKPVDIGTGIFVDTYVQFSGSETAPQIPEDSKLVVWVQAIDYDDNGTTEDTSDDIQGSTNLVVTAAMLSDAGVPTATNFVIETAADFDFEGWHRLTIRAIKSIDTGESIAGFTVFVDDEQLSAKETQIAGADAVIENDVVVTPAVPAVTYKDLMGAYAYTDNLTDEAKAFYNNCQLFVSLVRSGATAAQTLSAVGFDGTGKVDDVTVSDDRADFVFARGDFYFTMNWDAGITGFTVTATNAEEVAFTQTYTKTGAGSEVIVIPAAASQITISNITVATGSTYEGDASVDVDLLAANSYSLVTKTTLLTIDGEGYTDFATALAAADGKKMTLATSFSLAETTISGNVTIDLAGNTLTFEPELDDFENSSIFGVEQGASLKIVDSVGGGAVVYADGASSMYLINATGTFILGDVDDAEDKGATIGGAIMDNMTPYDPDASGDYAMYVRGSVMIEGNYSDADGSGGFSDGDAAYFAAFLYADENDNSSTVAVEGDYFVITPPTASEPEPTTFAVTVTEAANATYTVTGADDLTAVESGTQLTFTATAAEDYTYEGVELTGGWTIDANDATKVTYTVTVNDNLTVTVPTAVAVPAETFNVTVTANENATFTSNPPDLTGLEAGTLVTITATPNKGYTYAGVTPDGWTVAEGGATATYTATVTADLAVTVLAPTLIVPVAGGEAPQYATEADAKAAAAKMDVSAEDAALGINKSYFKPTVTGSDAAGWTVTTELDAEVVQPSTETAVKAIPEAIAAAAEGASITVNVSGVKAGLQYVVEVVTELGNLGNAKNLEGKTWTRAGTDGSLALPVTKPTGGKGFFKVHVKHR